MVERKYILRFSKDIWNKPLTCRLAKDFNLSFNILKANVLPRQESFLVLDIIGDEDELKKGIEYLKDCGVVVEYMEQDIQRDDEKCVHCGVCTSVCPTNALKMDRNLFKVIFDPSLCTACELCVKACPHRAMSIYIAK